MMDSIDQVRLNFNPQAQLGLNVVLALVMFGIALDLSVADFKAALRTPRALAIGLLCHHLLFPAFTFSADPGDRADAVYRAGHAAGLELPAGRISNFFTHRAVGNARCRCSSAPCRRWARSS